MQIICNVADKVMLSRMLIKTGNICYGNRILKENGINNNYYNIKGQKTHIACYNQVIFLVITRSIDSTAECFRNSDDNKNQKEEEGT